MGPIPFLLCLETNTLRLSTADTAACLLMVPFYLPLARVLVDLSILCAFPCPSTLYPLAFACQSLSLNPTFSLLLPTLSLILASYFNLVVPSITAACQQASTMSIATY